MMMPPPPAEGDDILPWALAIHRYVRGITLTSSGSVRVSQTGSGLIAEVSRRNRRDDTKPVHGPFEVYVTESGENGLTVRVAYGNLQKTEKMDDLAEITGLDSTTFTLAAARQCVYIEMTHDSDGEPTFEIKSGDTWEEWPEVCKKTGEEGEGEEEDKSQKYWHLLAMLREPLNEDEPTIDVGGQQLVLQQCSHTNLIIRTVCSEGEDRETQRQLWPWHTSPERFSTE